MKPADGFRWCVLLLAGLSLAAVLVPVLCRGEGPWDNIRPTGPWDNIRAGSCDDGRCSVLPAPLPPRADEPPPSAPQPPGGHWENYQRCPSCPVQRIWVADETPDEAALKLRDWRNLPEEEAKRLAAIVDRPAVEKALRQEWSLGTCQMLCRAHGSVLYDIHEDGSKTPAVEQPAEAPNEGAPVRGFCLFRRRR